MPTLFSRIISGEIPSYRVAESDQFYAFLDINPVQIGHTLIVPKKEIDYYFDLSDEELAQIQSFAKIVATAIQKHTQCIKVGMTVMGLEINHAHIHLIPLNKNGDMDIYTKKAQTSEQLAEVAQSIRAYLPEKYK